MCIQLCTFPKLEHSPVSASLSLQHLFPAKYTFGGLNQYHIMAPTHLLCIFLDGLLYERTPNPRSLTPDSSQLSRLHESRLYDLYPGCDPSLVLRSAFITSAPALNLREQTAVYCSAGDRVKISNRHVPQRDYRADITVIHQKSARWAESRLHFLFFIKHFQS